MSKIARNPVPVPSGVTVEVNGQDVKAKGPKGELKLQVHDAVGVALEQAEGGKKAIKLTPRSKSQQDRTLWGTSWSNLRNMVRGVSEGYVKNLELQGVGYRANMQGNTLVLQLGFSHDIQYKVPDGIKVAVDKQVNISVSGIDRQRVGQVAAEIRAFRPPEPYKGKGIRYVGEYIVRKEGKKK